MLNDVLSLGERIASPPATSWWDGELWIAYTNLDGFLTVRDVPVLADEGTGTSTTLGFASRGTAALAPWRGKLWLAFVGDDDQLSMTSSADGRAFDSPQSTGVFNEFAPRLAGAPEALYLAWSENAGGRVHLVRTVDGTTFDDIPLDVDASSNLGLLFDDEHSRLVLSWTPRTGGDGSLRIAFPEFSASPPVGRFTIAASLPMPEHARAATLVVLPGHGGDRYLVVAEHLVPGSTSTVPAARTVPSNAPFLSHQKLVASTGGEEKFLGRATQGLAIAAAPNRLYVAWHDASHDELMVAPYDAAFELPRELLEVLGTDCDPRTCSPDPRIVCSATTERVWVSEPANIPNARRGDLVLTPADGTGIIGTLLAVTDPEQYFDHMAIMVKDHTVLRHTTMAHKRIENEEYYTGSILGAEPAPTNGLRHDQLQYGWPGTITQTVDDAFWTGFNSWSPDPSAAPWTSMNPRWDYYAYHGDPHLPWPAANASADERDAFAKRRLFYDPERTADGYAIQNIPYVPAYRDGKLVFGCVIKPAPDLEAADAGLRSTLHRVADAADRIAGHYRFFAYTQAGIGTNHAYDAPPSGDSSWQGSPDGADWAAGTPGLVCSTFLWAAVRLANEKAPHLILEGNTTEGPKELLGIPPVDGLYRYTEEERRRAADALARYLIQTTRAEVRNKLAALEDDYPFVANLFRYELAVLASFLIGPAAIAATVLGTTPNNIAGLASLFNDMPTKLANQICNTFAFDRPQDVDDANWRNPGEGLTVAPDDIKNFWDPPAPAGRVRHGLWGHTEPLIPVERRTVPRVRHVYARADGVARVAGQVRFDRKPITGADVILGCAKDLTRKRGRGAPEYALEVRGGLQEIVASAYWPGTQQMLSVRKVVKLVPGDQRVDLDLEQPPAWRRMVRVFGNVEVIHQVLFGKDDRINQVISEEARLFWQPADWGGSGGPSDLRFKSIPFLSHPAGNERVHFTLSLWLNQDLSVSGGMSCQLLEDFWERDGEDLSDHIETGINTPVFTVAEDDAYTFVVDQKSNDLPPDRAHIELTISNERMPA